MSPRWLRQREHAPWINCELVSLTGSGVNTTAPNSERLSQQRKRAGYQTEFIDIQTHSIGRFFIPLGCHKELMITRLVSQSGLCTRTFLWVCPSTTFENSASSRVWTQTLDTRLWKLCALNHWANGLAPPLKLFFRITWYIWSHVTCFVFQGVLKMS